MYRCIWSSVAVQRGSNPRLRTIQYGNCFPVLHKDHLSLSATVSSRAAAKHALMGVAHVLLANVKSSRPLYKAPEHAGTPVNSVSAGSEKEWDIIIIGGGSAGCVLASR